MKPGPEKIAAFLNGLRSQMIVTPSPLAAAGPDVDDVRRANGTADAGASASVQRQS